MDLVMRFCMHCCCPCESKKIDLDAVGGGGTAYKSHLEYVAPFPVPACHLGTFEGRDRLYVIPLLVVLLLTCLQDTLTINFYVTVCLRRPRPHAHKEKLTHTGNRYFVLPIRRQPQISVLQGKHVS